MSDQSVTCNFELVDVDVPLNVAIMKIVASDGNRHMSIYGLHMLIPCSIKYMF